MASYNVVIDTYAAMAIVDHCKRVNACAEVPPTYAGFLIGSSKTVGKETTAIVTNILTSSRVENLNEIKSFITNDSRDRILGVYSTRNVDASVANIIKADQSLYLAVSLPTAENLSLELTATRMFAKTDADGKREFSFTDAPLRVASTDVGANVVLATVMGQIFPEVALELKNRDPLSVETYAVADKVGATKNELDVFVDHRKTLPHHISIVDLEKQLEDMAKIANEGAKGKNVGVADVSIAKEIASLRAEAKQCLADLEAKGDEQYAGDKFADVLTAKYISELSLARLAAVSKNIVEGKEVARRYEAVRSYGRGRGSSYSFGRGGRGGSSFGGRGGAPRGRGGRGGARGTFRGRGAAPASE